MSITCDEENAKFHACTITRGSKSSSSRRGISCHLRPAARFSLPSPRASQAACLFNRLSSFESRRTLLSKLQQESSIDTRLSTVSVVRIFSMMQPRNDRQVTEHRASLLRQQAAMRRSVFKRDRTTRRRLIAEPRKDPDQFCWAQLYL